MYPLMNQNGMLLLMVMFAGMDTYSFVSDEPANCQLWRKNIGFGARWTLKKTLVSALVLDTVATLESNAEKSAQV